MSDTAHDTASPNTGFDFNRWKTILLAVAKETGDDRALLNAAGVTYYLLLALFPAVTAFVSIYGLFTDPATVTKQMQVLEGVVPAGGLQIINDQLTRVTAHGAPTLGLALAGSLIVALWSASSGVNALFDVMNVAYEEPERRNFFVRTALALGFTVVGVLGAIVMIGAVVAIPVILSLVGFSTGIDWLVRIAGYVVMALVLLFGIDALYALGPSRSKPRWQLISPGAVLACIGIAAVSLLFSWYAANLAHFDDTYGSLGALIGFLFWTWVSISAVIVGAELNAQLEKPIEKHVEAPVYASDDPRRGRSSDWVAGFEAAQRRKLNRPRLRTLPLAAALLALARRPSR